MRLIRLLGRALLAGAVQVSLSAQAQEAGNLSERAAEAYQRKEYGRSAELYAEAARRDAPHRATFYNAARAHAAAGMKEEAFAYLRQAVTFGFADPARMQRRATAAGGGRARSGGG